VFVVCDSARGVLNFAQLMFKNVEPKNTRLSMHVGSVSIDSTVSGSSIEETALVEVSTITLNAMPGLFYCSDQVAAVLLLDRQDILVHPVGMIEIGESKKSIEIYTIDLLPQR
jgi:hypothetical protein